MVVVVGELGQDPAQMTFANGNQVIEALPTGCPHPAFRDRVRAGCPNRGPQTLDIHGDGTLAEVGAPDSVTVVDQISRLAVPGRGLDQLPPDPGGARMGGHLEVDKLTATMTDEEKDLQGSKGQGLDDEKVSRPDRLSVIGKKCAPALARRSRRARPAVAADRARADHNPELEQLAADPLAAPKRVLTGHGGDQLPNFRTQSWPAHMQA